MTPKEAIETTQKELNENASKWQDRFVYYMTKTIENKQDIIERRKKFRKWGNLSVYFTIGRAKDNSNYFDLRYQGQSVGQISVSRSDNTVKLHISKTQYANNCNEKYLTGYPKDICTAGCYEWHSKTAKEFRKYFKTAPEKQEHPEHKYENLLLNELSERDGKQKSLTFIQPITIGKDLYFQMPTPLTASGNVIEYSDGHGGIDILARRREGRKNTLTVFELKDEYKETEKPEKVICQAIAYATFIAELCKTKAYDKFCELCGLRKIDTIYVSILMPDPEDGIEPSFTHKVYSVPNSEIRLELHYTYFDKEGVKITRTSLVK